MAHAERQDYETNYKLSYKTRGRKYELVEAISKIIGSMTMYLFWPERFQFPRTATLWIALTYPTQCKDGRSCSMVSNGFYAGENENSYE